MRIISSRFIVLLLLAVSCYFLTPLAAVANITQAQLDEITQLWQTSAHALTEVNCSSCHQDPETKQLEEEFPS